MWLRGLWMERELAIGTIGYVKQKKQPQSSLSGCVFEARVPKVCVCMCVC